MRILLLIAILCCTTLLDGQPYFTEIHSRWADKFDEWELISVDGETEYITLLSLKWPLQNNWEEWRIEGDLVQGSIKTKWRGDTRQWEVRTSQQLILISQLFRGDVSQWEISDGANRIIIRTLNYNNPNAWHLPRQKDQWLMFMEYTNDPRDWIVEDYLEIPNATVLKIAMSFIVLWQSIPKG